MMLKTITVIIFSIGISTAHIRECEYSMRLSLSLKILTWKDVMVRLRDMADEVGVGERRDIQFITHMANSVLGVRFLQAHESRQRHLSGLIRAGERIFLKNSGQESRDLAVNFGMAVDEQKRWEQLVAPHLEAQVHNHVNQKANQSIIHGLVQFLFERMPEAPDLSREEELDLNERFYMGSNLFFKLFVTDNVVDASPVVKVSALVSEALRFSYREDDPRAALGSILFDGDEPLSGGALPPLLRLRRRHGDYPFEFYPTMVDDLFGKWLYLPHHHIPFNAKSSIISELVTFDAANFLKNEGLVPLYKRFLELKGIKDLLKIVREDSDVIDELPSFFREFLRKNDLLLDSDDLESLRKSSSHHNPIDLALYLSFINSLVRCSGVYVSVPFRYDFASRPGNLFALAHSALKSENHHPLFSYWAQKFELEEVQRKGISMDSTVRALQRSRDFFQELLNNHLDTLL
jgi:hypothetical protein